MKLFITLTALVAVVAAGTVNRPIGNENAEVEAIIAAINSPNTDPATAVLLEQQLLEIVQAIAGASELETEAADTIAVGPALVDAPLNDVIDTISVGPAIIPIVESGSVSTPVAAPSNSPVVQIILNVNLDANSSPVSIPVAIPSPGIGPNIVDMPSPAAAGPVISEHPIVASPAESPVVAEHEGVSVVNEVESPIVVADLPVMGPFRKH